MLHLIFGFASCLCGWHWHILGYPTGVNKPLVLFTYLFFTAHPCSPWASKMFVINRYRISCLGGASLPDHVQPDEQADSSQQPPLPLHPGRQWHNGEVRRWGQTAASAREAHLPSEDQHTWVYCMSHVMHTWQADLLAKNKRRRFLMTQRVITA